MARQKKKEAEAPAEAPKPTPRDYYSIRIWAGLHKWGAELLIEEQERAAKEGQPLDVVFFDHAAEEGGAWVHRHQIRGLKERAALGLGAVILVCPECQSDNISCTACGAVYQIRDGLGLCENERCLAVTGTLECQNGVCGEVVSFSGKGVVVIETKGDKDGPVLHPWGEIVDGAPAAEATG